MEDIQIKVSKETRVAVVDEYCIGNDGENLQAKLVFSFVDQFVDGVARLEYKVKNKEYYAMLTKNGDTYELPIKSIMTKAGALDVQLVITEGIDENETPIFKSSVFNLYCNSSINAEIEQPEEYPNWMDVANTKLNQMDNLDIDIQDSVVTIKRKDGTTKVENVRGEKGEKGEPGVVKMMFFAHKEELPAIGSGDTLYFVKVENPTTTNYYQEYAWVNKGTEEEPNWDYEDLGGAVLNVDLADYVKKTDFATGDTAGVVKVHRNYGIYLRDDTLAIASAGTHEIDVKSNGMKPIVPENLDYAVKMGITDNKLEWTDEEKTNACNLINAVEKIPETTGKTQIYTNKLSNITGKYTVELDGYHQAGKFAIPTRNSKGVIYIPDVACNDDGAIPTGQIAVNRNYVDNLIAQLREELGLTTTE